MSENLHDNTGTAGGLTVFGKLTNLQQLELDDNYILTVSGLPSELAQLSALKCISLSYNLYGRCKKLQRHAWVTMNNFRLKTWRLP